MKTLLKNIGQLATFKGNKAKHGEEMKDICLCDDCCIFVEDGVIEDIVPSNLMPLYADGAKIIDCKGGLVTAGFVDCHTHLVFAGNRAKEFNMRLNGATYMEIMKSGGGIINTVSATRAATKEQLLQVSMPRVLNALHYGVTTMEAKSGYGLDIHSELKQIEVAHQLNKLTPVTVVPTFMGAHATPKEMTTDQYVWFIIEQLLPAVKRQNKAVFCDCFCEKGVFDATQCKRILLAAHDMGFKLKIHADEIESIGGIKLACDLNATSTEHLLKITDEDISRLSQSDTVGVVLPATAFSLRENFAPARKMIDAGCAVAVATDFNPGSCSTQSFPLILALSNMYCGLSVAETLCAVTLNAAAALCLGDKIGTLEKHKQADIIVHNVKSLDELCYRFAEDTAAVVLKSGKVVYKNPNLELI